jgi:hypothetical protein
MGEERNKIMEKLSRFEQLRLDMTGDGTMLLTDGRTDGRKGKVYHYLKK